MSEDGKVATPTETPASTATTGQRKKSVTIKDRLSFISSFILEKTGKGLVSEEGQDFLERVKQFGVARKELAEALQRAKALYQSEVSITEAERGFSSALAKLGSHSKADPTASHTVQAFVPYNLQLQAHRTENCTRFKELLLDPLQTINDNEVSNVVKMLADLPNKRMAFDTRKRLLANLESKADDAAKQNAEQNVEETKAKYEKCQSDIVDLIDLVESRKNAVLGGQLLEYTKAMHKFYADSCQLVEDKMHAQLQGEANDPEDQIS